MKQNLRCGRSSVIGRIELSSINQSTSIVTGTGRVDGWMVDTVSLPQHLVLEARRQGNDALFVLVFFQKGQAFLIGASSDQGSPKEEQ